MVSVAIEFFLKTGTDRNIFDVFCSSIQRISCLLIDLLIPVMPSVDKRKQFDTLKGFKISNSTFSIFVSVDCLGKSNSFRKHNTGIVFRISVLIPSDRPTQIRWKNFHSISGYSIIGLSNLYVVLSCHSAGVLSKHKLINQT